MVNALECLEAIDELGKCFEAIQLGDIKKASRLMTSFRYPGPWEPEKLHKARKLAIKIRAQAVGFPDSSMKSHILKKTDPFVDMVYKR